MALTMSHVAGPTMPAVREMTFGDLLRQAAESAPDRLALIAGVPDPAQRRQWTYSQLYREAAAHRPRAAQPLQEGRAHRGVGAKSARMDHARIRRRHGGHGAGHREPGLSRQRSAICAEAVARRRRLRGQQFPRQSDAGDGAGGEAELPRIARDHLLRRLECLHCRGRRRGHQAAGRQPRRSGHDPVHLGHHGLSEGGPAPPSRAVEQRRRYRRPDRGGCRRRLHHHHAAVSHRRLRVLRDGRGVEGGDTGAGRGLRPGAGAGDVRAPTAATRCSAFPPC